MTILYAEDDREDVDFFSEILRIADPESTCLYCEDGIEALDMLSNLVTIPDYIFLDINMPSMDGRTCLREIRRDGRFKNVPIIIYTTGTDPKEKALCLELGATAYLSKPITTEEGVASLSNLFAKKAFS
ncbi:hypothetical protein BH09BAC3_BH09BAC3_12780 [soil metagenome]